MSTTETSPSAEPSPDPAASNPLVRRFPMRRHPVQVGPAAHLAVERERLDALR